MQALEKGRGKAAGWIDGKRWKLSASQITASARRIHPLAFGLPPFGLEGKRFDGQAKRLLYFRPNLEVLCRTSISKGALAYRYSQYVR